VKRRGSLFGETMRTVLMLLLAGCASSGGLSSCCAGRPREFETSCYACDGQIVAPIHSCLLCSTKSEPDQYHTTTSSSGDPSVWALKINTWDTMTSQNDASRFRTLELQLTTDDTEHLELRDWVIDVMRILDRVSRK
jgi:hypothetical protein